MTNLKKKAAIAIASNDLTLIRELRRAVDNKRQKLSELDEAILEATDDDSLFEQELVRADEEQLSCGVWIEKLQDSPWANSKIVTSFSKSSGPRFDRLDGSRMIKERDLEG